MSRTLTAEQIDTAQRAILNAERIVVTTHKSPDGDAVGSALAMHHFLCSIGKKPTTLLPDAAPDFLHWVGKEVESDLTFCYLELYRKPDFVSLTLTNDLLVAYFPEQQNIVDLSVMGTTQTLVFFKDRIQQTFYR